MRSKLSPQYDAAELTTGSGSSYGMNEVADVRSQLKSLGIAREQRPRRGRSAARRWAVRLVVFAVLLAVSATAWRNRERISEFSAARLPGGEAKTPAIPIITVASRTDSEAPPVLTATGKIVSDHRVQVSTKVSGQIVALFFEQGDRVERGQVLARIEDVVYRARRDEAAANLERSRANLAYQRVNFARVESLSRGEQAQPIEFADARRWLDDAISQVAADEAALSFAQKALDDCEVVAPIAGVILERNVEVGDFVAAEGGRGANANAQFGAIADMTKLRVEVDVSELDINRLHRNMPCVITPDAYKDRRYRGFILWIDPGANYSKATVQVKVRIENPDEFLRVEGSAQVAFLSEAATPEALSRRAIWIPASAIRTDAATQTQSVFVVREGLLKKQPIVTGRRLGGQLEVTSGLSDGDRIVSDGVDKLTDGQRAPSAI